MAKSRAPRRPLWLIANRENGQMGVFTLGSDDDKETLPVFSFEEEAETFLRLGETGTGWRARETTAGELISLLHGPYAGVKRVALDPLLVGDGEMAFDLAGWGRRDFLRDFVGAAPALNHERWAEMPVSTSLLESPNGASPDGKGKPSRETEEERARMENGAATGRKPERIRDELLNEDGEAAILDYVVQDFGSPKEVGEDLAGPRVARTPLKEHAE
jgi:hypothetical protein